MNEYSLAKVQKIRNNFISLQPNRKSMKKIFIFITLFVFLSCSQGNMQPSFIQEDSVKSINDFFLIEREKQFDSIYRKECDRLGWHSKDTSTIAWICAFEQTGLPLTKEEIAHWDSINELGDGVIIRGSERDLDTIINHLKYWFVTAE